uniref:Uncharacterized protein n=1 Tax=Trypanosoma vivax (strain Y486) TaxID=1055687 RepID=G0TRP2_TRYVY|nr:hypothetical protein TVY486_0200320 [Trypanosoma vivax Y486]
MQKMGRKWHRVRLCKPPRLIPLCSLEYLGRPLYTQHCFQTHMVAKCPHWFIFESLGRVALSRLFRANRLLETPLCHAAWEGLKRYVRQHCRYPVNGWMGWLGSGLKLLLTCCMCLFVCIRACTNKYLPVLIFV